MSTTRPSCARPRATRCSAGRCGGRPGLRPARLGTVTHALVRAVCGQLITAREAVQIERRLLRAICAPAGDLRLPPEASDLARLSAAGAERAGLSPRRSAALVRVSRTLDLERLRTVPAQAAVEAAVRRAGARAVVGRRRSPPRGSAPTPTARWATWA